MPNAKIEPVPLGDDTGDDLVELEEDVKKDDFLQLLRAVYPRYGVIGSDISNNSAYHSGDTATPKSSPLRSGRQSSN